MMITQNIDTKGGKGSPPRLLDCKAAARYIGLSYWTVRGMLHSGQIPFVRAGRRILIDVQDLDHWIEVNKIQEEPF
jgi:excisionase family DNA binding protein